MTQNCIIQFRIPLYLKKEFYDIVIKNKKVPSKVIRELIRDYINNNKEDNTN